MAEVGRLQRWQWDWESCDQLSKEERAVPPEVLTDGLAVSV